MLPLSYWSRDCMLHGQWWGKDLKNVCKNLESEKEEYEEYRQIVKHDYFIWIYTFICIP